MVTFEIDGQRITLNNIDPFHLLILLGDKVDKNIIYNIAKPDFTIVVRPSYKPNFKTKEGDYDIIIRKDSRSTCSRCCLRRWWEDCPTNSSRTVGLQQPSRRFTTNSTARVVICG